MAGVNHLEIAAHVDHGIAHTSEGAQISLGIGFAVVAAVAIVATGGAAIVIGGVTVMGASSGALAFIGSVSLAGSVGMDAGELIDKHLRDKVVDEWIKDGIDSVLLGPLAKKAARAHPTTKVSKHNHVGEGSKIVMLGREFAPMSRRQDRTACGGIITQGIKSIVVGGTPSSKGIDIDETSSWFVKAMKFTFGMGQAAGAKSVTEGVLTGAGTLADLAGQKEAAALAKAPSLYKNPFGSSLLDSADYASTFKTVGERGIDAGSRIVGGP